MAYRNCSCPCSSGFLLCSHDFSLGSATAGQSSSEGSCARSPCNLLRQACYESFNVKNNLPNTMYGLNRSCVRLRGRHAFQNLLYFRPRPCFTFEGAPQLNCDSFDFLHKVAVIQLPGFSRLLTTAALHASFLVQYRA